MLEATAALYVNQSVNQANIPSEPKAE